jgi:hypothetical protein
MFGDGQLKRVVSFTRGDPHQLPAKTDIFQTQLADLYGTHPHGVRQMHQGIGPEAAGRRRIEAGKKLLHFSRS